MSKVNPKIDLVFKKLFGNEKNINILKSLLNSILPQNEQVATLELKNPYNPSDYASGKLSYLDIKAQDENKKWYDIEMQIAPQDFFGLRLLFYWAKVFASQIQRGGTYTDLHKTIVISIIDFNYFIDETGKERYHRNIGLTDLETNEKYEQTDGLSLHFIELQKFKTELKYVKTTLDRWLTFLNNAHKYSKDTLPEQLANDNEIKTAMQELEVMNFDEKEQEYYEAQEKFLLDRNSYDKSIQNKTKIEIAKGLKQDGIPNHTIAKNTGLTIDEINNL